MKKLISMLLAVVLCLSLGTVAFAAEEDTSAVKEFNFAEYLESHKIVTRDDFLNVIKEYGSETAVESIASCKDDFSAYKGTDYLETFSYTIDYDNQLIYTNTTVKKDVVKEGGEKATTYVTTASTQHEAYSWCGIHIFTVSTDGSFTRQPGSYCRVRTSHGYFNPAFLSLWNASTWISTGNYDTKKAYIDTYGTANLNFAVAQVLGITLNIQSVNYSLVLTCDSYGNVSGSYSQY